MRGTYAELPAINVAPPIGGNDHLRTSWYRQRGHVGFGLEVQKVIQLPAIERPEHNIYVQKMSSRQRKPARLEKVGQNEKQEKILKEKQSAAKANEEMDRKKVRFLSPLARKSRRMKKKRSEGKRKQKTIRNEEDDDKIRLNEICKRIREIGKLNLPEKISDENTGNAERSNEHGNKKRKELAIFVPY